MSVVSDPDYLAILARGLALATAKFQRQEVQGTEEASAQRRGRVLDSLACILISHPKQQAVAVGAVLDGRAPDGGIVLLVSENNPLPETVEHLNAVLARLRALEIQLTSSPPLPGFIFAETTSELERKLIELEGFMIHHVWPKLCHRFTKSLRHENFLETTRAVCGAPVERTDLSVDEQKHLAVLQSFPELLDQDHGTGLGIPSLLTAVTGLARVVVSDQKVEWKLVVVIARASLYIMANLLRPLEENGQFRAAWDVFTRCRILSKNGAVASGDFEN